MHEYLVKRQGLSEERVLESNALRSHGPVIALRRFEKVVVDRGGVEALLEATSTNRAYPLIISM